MFVEPSFVLVLSDVQDVSYTDMDGYPGLQFHFTPEGSKKLADATRARVGERLAVFVNNALFTAPIIQGPILNGEAVLTGAYSEAQLRDCVRQIDAALRP